MTSVIKGQTKINSFQRGVRGTIQWPRWHISEQSIGSPFFSSYQILCIIKKAMLDNHSGKISQTESVLVGTYEGKKCLIKSIVITNNSDGFNVKLDLYVNDGIKKMYLAPKNLELNIGEMFIFDTETLLNSGMLLKAKITNTSLDASMRTSGYQQDLNLLDYNVTIDILE